MNAIKVLDNFIDNNTCDSMIQVYKNLYDSFYTTGDNRKLIKNSNNPEVIKFLKIYLPKISELLGDKYYIRDLLLSIYETGAFLKPHIDYNDKKLKDSLGVLFYFNDNFEGGELYFSKFDYKYKPNKGSVIIFPCNNPTYEHGVYEIIKGIRYTMPIEITTNLELDLYQV